MHEVPHQPMDKLGMDIFEFEGEHFLLLVDYYSRYPWIRRMKSLHSKEVIDLLKTIFSENGCPNILYTDQGTQFTSAEFYSFATAYGFDVQHSSPKLPQANGLAEALVKVVKNLLKRSLQSGQDPHLALQAYRATPFASGQKSPAEMLNSRKMRTLIPIKACLTDEQQRTREDFHRAKTRQAEYYNQRAKLYEELQRYQRVYVQLDPSKAEWSKATIISTPTEKFPRSYIVQTDQGRKFQRNRRFLKPRAKELPKAKEPTVPSEVPGGQVTQTQPSGPAQKQNCSRKANPTTTELEPVDCPEPQMTTTRSGRTIRRPDRLVEQ